MAALAAALSCPVLTAAQGAGANALQPMISACGYPPPTTICTPRYQCDPDSGGWIEYYAPKGTACGNGLTCDGEGNCPSISGKIYPAYYISAVIYQPPGVGSGVTYTAQNQIGSTTSTSKSWSAGWTVEASATLSFSGFGTQEMSFTFGKQWGNTRTDSVDVVETWNYDSQFTWPKTEVQFDYINHDDDQILLLFNLQSDITVDPTVTSWALSPRPPPYVVERIVLTVGQLLGRQIIDSATLNWLAARGVTAADFPQILNANPFANDPAGTMRDRLARPSALQSGAPDVRVGALA